MKQWALVLVMVLACTAVCFADSESPKTKIESFLLRSGVIYQKQWIDLGEMDNLEFKAIILSNQNNTVVSKGLNISVTYIKDSASAWLDLDEINDLLKAIDYMDKTSKLWENKPLENYTEVIFSTKDDFKVGFYCSKASKVELDNIKLFISAGRIHKMNKTMDIDKLDEFKQIIMKGLASIQ